MSTSEREQDREIPYRSAVGLPLWREAFWGLEWVRFRRSEIYAGGGVPRGNGDPIVLVPGFLGSDASMQEMHLWLERIGYRGFSSGIGRNDDCPDVLLERLIEKVEAVTAETGKPVRVIGHSLGGTLGRAAAIERPEMFAQLISLGSPVNAGGVHPLVLNLARFMSRRLESPNERPRQHGDHFHVGSCSCRLNGSLSRRLPAHLPRASIFSRSDGVVDWRASQEQAPGLNVEIRGTHLGLPVKGEALRGNRSATCFSWDGMGAFEDGGVTPGERRARQTIFQRKEARAMCIECGCGIEEEDEVVVTKPDGEPRQD